MEENVSHFHLNHGEHIFLSIFALKLPALSPVARALLIIRHTLSKNRFVPPSSVENMQSLLRNASWSLCGEVNLHLIVEVPESNLRRTLTLS